MYVSKIRCDGKSEKFCKIFWELNMTFVQKEEEMLEQGHSRHRLRSNQQGRATRAAVVCAPCLLHLRYPRPAVVHSSCCSRRWAAGPAHRFSIPPAGAGTGTGTEPPWETRIQWQSLFAIDVRPLSPASVHVHACSSFFCFIHDRPRHFLEFPRTTCYAGVVHKNCR
jgi:hypothetical protein